MNFVSATHFCFRANHRRNFSAMTLVDHVITNCNMSAAAELLGTENPLTLHGALASYISWEYHSFRLM